MAEEGLAGKGPRRLPRIGAATQQHIGTLPAAAAGDEQMNGRAQQGQEDQRQQPGAEQPEPGEGQLAGKAKAALKSARMLSTCRTSPSSSQKALVRL